MISPAGVLVGRLLSLGRKPAGSSIMCALDMARAKWSLRGYGVGRSVRVRRSLILDIRGELRIGDRVSFVGKVLPTSLTVHRGGALLVGDDTVFNYGVSVESTSRVTIGRRCLFGSFVRIADRDAESAGPVVIGDDVWVAHGAVIGPGVVIGSGSVVAAGSVVMKDVPPQAMALGNPARMVSLSFWADGPTLESRT